ncbi:MAG: metallophosphoesterase [Candidatus Binatia bacterium]
MIKRGSAVMLVVVLALSSTGCVHQAPYYRGGHVALLPPAPATQVDHRLLLIGDAGDPDPKGEPVLDLLGRHVRLMPDRTTVVFLGDNVYERGMPDSRPKALDAAATAANVILPNVFDSRSDAERILLAQIQPMRRTSARTIFIPGNHDWGQFEVGGWERVLAQEEFIRVNTLDNVDVAFVPEGGCPGPVSMPLGRQGMLIMLDTQWWLQYGSKPTPEDNPTNCTNTTEEEVTRALVSQLKVAALQGRWAIVAGHHPLNSAGAHGGFVDMSKHLFPMRFLRHYLPFYLEWLPLPGLGTFAVLARRHFSPSPQDASNAKNEHLRRTLRSAMAEAELQSAPALAYAAGHDHSLQVFRSGYGPRHALVSGLGSASRSSVVGATENTLFAHSHPKHAGFMQVDFLRNGHVRLSVIEVDEAREGGGGEVFSMMLADADTPRDTRPAAKRSGIWSRVKERAKSTWWGLRTW